MTRIDFYRYAEDKVRFACRLAAKAFDHSSRVVVYSPDPQVLAEFDRALWTFQSTRFVPHCSALSHLAAETSVILSSSGDSLPHRDVLLNLSAVEPPFFATLHRLLEIVAADEPDKERARARWKFYKAPGYDIHVTAVDGSAH